MDAHELLLLPETLLWAWRKARRCYQSADSLFDQSALISFDLNLEAELASIRADFALGRWICQPIRPVPQPKKPDKDGKPRVRQYFEISVRDQVAWIAMATVLGPELDRRMPAWSYGNRLYRAAWYDEVSTEGNGSQLNIGPYRHSGGHLYRHFKHSWPLYRRHISLTARQMAREGIERDELDNGELRALDQSDELPYLELNFWDRPEDRGQTIYAASLDLAKFYPSIRKEAILRAFATHVEGYRDTPRISSLLNDMLQFQVDDNGLTDEMKAALEPPVAAGPFERIPTGLFAGGFLANVAMLPLDRDVDERLRKKRTIAHFRFVDDHEILAYDFDSLINWIKEYSSLLEQSGIGAKIEPDKYIPVELGDILPFERNELADERLQKYDEAYQRAVKSSEINGLKPTALMTRTLAQVSMLAATDFDLLTDAGREQRLEQLEWLLLANIPEQEIRGDTRMAFAAAKIASLTPALFQPDNSLLDSHRDLAVLQEKKRKMEKSGQQITERLSEEIQRLFDQVTTLQRAEEKSWNILLKRHFGLLFEAFHAHPDKARLFIRMLDYCRATGYQGFPRITEWLLDHSADEKRLLKAYLGALGIQILARHILTACGAINKPDLLHRERQASKSFLENLLKSELEAFIPMGALPIQRFQLNSRNALAASLLFGALEIEKNEASIAAMMRERGGLILRDEPTIKNLETGTSVPVGVWSHWFFTAVGRYRDLPPDFWHTLANAHDVMNQFDWASLRRYPSKLPDTAWKRLGIDPGSLAVDDEGWLLDAVRAVPEKLATLSPEVPMISVVAARMKPENDAIPLQDWVSFARTLTLNDPRRSEWTALEILRQLIEPLFDFNGPDADFLDTLHPENILVPSSWRNVGDGLLINRRITWEGWRQIARGQSPKLLTPPLADFRYAELLSLGERRWDRRLRAIGQLLWGILRQNFSLPVVWNIRGQERGLSNIIGKDLECLPISSSSLEILQSCLLPRPLETSLLKDFPSLFGNLHHTAADDSEFDRPISSPADLRLLLEKAQTNLQRNQMTVLEHEPRQLIPVRLQQIVALAGNTEDSTEGDNLA
ncbi:RNA-directed DNA polymerase [Agrobacterium radiobacter]|uniref:RNA-directed DNA polymerase n=1 Tax=Agrobacterium radiobacter TaxID=362 RepID=UPI003C2F81CC